MSAYSDGSPDWMDEEEEGEQIPPGSGYLRSLIEAINRADEEEGAEEKR
jgi:hypothetical protein